MNWEKEFDKQFNNIDTFGKAGVIYSKDGSMKFDENYSQLGAIKNFIKNLLKEKQIIKAVSEANFMQWFKMEYWKLDNPTENELDDLAIKIIKYLK